MQARPQTGAGTGGIATWRDAGAMIQTRRFERRPRASPATMIIITDNRCTAYHREGHPERPARIARTVARLEQAASDLDLRWEGPAPVREETLLRAHSADHLERLAVPLDFDADTPSHPDIRAHAGRSAGAALRSLDFGLAGETAFSLIRPPGHHATRDQAMGFCYLSNAAIMALEARARGLERVAVFDFDVHHGNGTEAILLGEPGCAFFSVHQYPAYPGTGRESFQNAFNQPVLPGAARALYRAALEKAFDALTKFRPSLVIVSAGFDAFAGDPLSDAPLEPEDFAWLGRTLGSLDAPLCSVLEGGYSTELPELILSYLTGLRAR